MMIMMMLMARVKTETMMNLVTMTMVMTSATAMMMTMMTMMMTRTAMMMQSQAATPASGWPADRKKPHNHNFYSLPTNHQPHFHFYFCSIFFNISIFFSISTTISTLYTTTNLIFILTFVHFFFKHWGQSYSLLGIATPTSFSQCFFDSLTI